MQCSEPRTAGHPAGGLRFCFPDSRIRAERGVSPLLVELSCGLTFDFRHRPRGGSTGTSPSSCSSDTDSRPADAGGVRENSGGIEGTKGWSGRCRARPVPRSGEHHSGVGRTSLPVPAVGGLLGLLDGGLLDGLVGGLLSGEGGVFGHEGGVLAGDDQLGDVVGGLAGEAGTARWRSSVRSATCWRRPDRRRGQLRRPVRRQRSPPRSRRHPRRSAEHRHRPPRRRLLKQHLHASSLRLLTLPVALGRPATSRPGFGPGKGMSFEYGYFAPKEVLDHFEWNCPSGSSRGTARRRCRRIQGELR